MGEMGCETNLTYILVPFYKVKPVIINNFYGRYLSSLLKIAIAAIFFFLSFFYCVFYLFKFYMWIFSKLKTDFISKETDNTNIYLL